MLATRPSLEPTPSQTASDHLRKGWCPGVLRPMEARDGLVVRLRLTGGILPGTTAVAVADLADDYGNGLLDLTARGNLQLRGIASEGWPALVDALRRLDLVDATADGEAVRNVLASPLAGLGTGLDIRPLVRDLEAVLGEDAILQRLPAKILILIDDGSEPSLASVAADLRFDWTGAGFSIGLGGDRAGALRIGACAAADLPECARRCGHALVALFAAVPDVRRVSGLVARLGAVRVAEACGGTVERATDAALVAYEGLTAASSTLVGLQHFGTVPALGLGVPFGRLDAAMLRRAATLGAAELRLTPWRVMLLLGVAGALAPGSRRFARDDVSRVLASEAAQARSRRTDLAVLREAGFIIDADDPRLRVVACVGRDGCPRGTTPTHADAAALAAWVTPGTLVHVSGCEKGCARGAAAPITLVGRDGWYDLVRHGRAGDPPEQRGLDIAAAAEFLREAVV